MTINDKTERDESEGNAVTWRTVVGLGAILTLAAGWYLLSSRVMGNTPRDAFGEALGVAFALMLVTAVVGTIVGRRHGGDPDMVTPEAAADNQPETR